MIRVPGFSGTTTASGQINTTDLPRIFLPYPTGGINQPLNMVVGGVDQTGSVTVDTSGLLGFAPASGSFGSGVTFATNTTSVAYIGSSS
jgi:hypothetical protein